MSELLVVGTVATDDIETPYGGQTDVLGGSATYFAAGASFFAPVRMVGVVGDDFRMERLDFLRRRGCDLAGIEIVKGGKTFRWSGRYHHDLNHRDTLGTWLNVLETFQPKLPAAWRDTPYLFLANIEPSLQRQVLEQMERPKLVVADTMNFWIQSARPQLERTLGLVDGLIVNDEEARMLSGVPNLIKSAATVRKMGPQLLIVKKGEHGALLFEGSKLFSAPAYPLEDVRDPTGAGDTFAGGFFGYIAKQDRTDEATLRKAVLYGSALASFCVEDFGPKRLETLTMKEIEARVGEFHDLTRIG
jgi:sugar/nucleoside kinase (ribokinase family)